MLVFLRIRNLAVIESLEVEFDRGFNVLTGETGAGKSVLVGAVGLLLGARASADLVRTGEAAATIEAVFETDERELVVRREITAQGRSRAFIDGALVPATALRDLSITLVELHGQHEHQALLDPSLHLSVLDQYLRHDDLLSRVSTVWTRVARLREQLERVGMEAGERAARLELVTYQLNEIQRLGLKPGEDEELAILKQVLASAERVQRLCDESHAALYESDNAALGILSAARKRLAELASIDAQFESHVETLEAVASQVEDVAFSVRSYGERIEASPEKLQQVEDRLAAVERLKRKHGPTLDDVLEKGSALNRERELLVNSAGGRDEIEAQLDQATRDYEVPACELADARRRGAIRFREEMEALLGELAMPGTRFEVRLNREPLTPDLWGPSGIDQGEFFLSPNPGEELKPLARIASGGELSRIMLALKTLAAQRGRTSNGGLRTLIFDEVDAGIGGQVADVVGARLRDLGRQFQVLCITHLPQIAAKAAVQFQISKQVLNQRTSTQVRRLDAGGRVEEVARMIGGGALTDAVRASAREMLDSALGTAACEAKAKGESESPRRGESEKRNATRRPGRRSSR
jgi:DNA repair protein RecN (Recombination protein N)